ncbi:MAG TPA: beta-N-acetylhexosaminidase [Methylococcaceae bacterium]|nr:beta-N-acetylhexosaminidase [Methylococcaceae bacterium]
MTRPLAPGPVMLDLRGAALETDEREWLRHPAAGGVILFTRNYQNPEQLAALVAGIRRARAGELLVAVDHEGGRVQRFRDGFTRLPPAAHYLQTCGGDMERAAELAKKGGWLMAAELRALDVDFSFAPVVDVDSGVSEIIGNRAFARDAEAVTRLALAFQRGMKRAGMAAVAKHFPGHGGVAADSHLALPVDGRPLADLLARDVHPYPALIAAGLEGIMPAHVVYPAVDDQPAGFSRFWLGEVLRGRLGFQGAIFSDDLSMEGAAAAGSYAERTRLALDAGCDMLPVCNRPEAIPEVLDTVGTAEDATRARRLSAMRGRGRIERRELLAGVEWRETARAIQILAETNA